LKLLTNDNQEIDLKDIAILDVNANQRIAIKLDGYEKLNPNQKTVLLNMLNAFFMPARCVLFPVNTEISVIEVNDKELKIN
jgi:hypothetical protein